MRRWSVKADRCRSVDEVLEAHADIEAGRTSLDFEIDGIVIEVDEIPARSRMGNTARHPRWALAFKFTAREGETVIEDIVVQQLKASLEYFRSRHALDIRGLGTETVDLLVDQALIKNVADLFSLRADDLRRLGRFGEVSAGNLVRAIDKARRTELGRFLYGLGIPGVGTRTRASWPIISAPSTRFRAPMKKP